MKTLVETLEEAVRIVRQADEIVDALNPHEPRTTVLRIQLDRARRRLLGALYHARPRIAEK